MINAEAELRKPLNRSSFRLFFGEGHIMKSLKHPLISLPIMFLVLGIWGASSQLQQNRHLSNSKTPAPIFPSPEQSSPQTTSGSSGALAQAATDEEQTRAWKTYQYPSSDFTFRYPQNLVLSREGSRIKLQHSIKFKHLDPCDYSDNARSLSRLVDFAVSFELVSKDNEKSGQSGGSEERRGAAPDTAKQSNTGDYGSITVGSLKGEFERLFNTILSTFKLAEVK